jgi:hypothetical protein
MTHDEVMALIEADAGGRPYELKAQRTPERAEPVNRAQTAYDVTQEWLAAYAPHCRTVREYAQLHSVATNLVFEAEEEDLALAAELAEQAECRAYWTERLPDLAEVLLG